MAVSAVLVLGLLGLLALATGQDCPAGRQEQNHNEAILHKALFCAYKTDYRPVKDHKTAIKVGTKLVLKYLSFDDLEETLNIHSLVVLTWKDEYLTWTPSDYGNIKEIIVKSHEIWTPEMALFNADASLYSSDSFYTSCQLANDGTVTCVPDMVHSGLCSTALGRWPYDVQNCTLYFGSWMHTGEQINFTFINLSQVALDDFTHGPGWELKQVYSERESRIYKNSSYPMLKYTFTLKREAAGPAAMTVAPSCVVIVMTLVALLLDVKDNIRLFLACFSLFGHFIFLSEVGVLIPKHSSDTPILLLFIRDSMIVTLVVILETLMLSSLRRRTLPPPTWIVSLSRVLTSGPVRYAVFTEFDPNDLEKKILSDDGPSSNINEERSRTTGDWIQFANILNSFLFIITLLTYLILIFVYIPRDD